MAPGHEIRVLADPDLVAEAAVGEMESSLGGSPWGRVVLAGGTTPGALYQRLAARPGPVAWNRLRFTWTDERCVPPDHPDSNAKFARDRLLDPLGVPDENQLRLRGELPAPVAADRADRELTVWAQREPLFDLVLLGLGADAHCASLFPADAWPEFGMRRAAAVKHPDGSDRITLTPRALRSTRRTLFLVTGEGKAKAVAETLTAPEGGPRRPAREVVDPARGALWLLDRDAASALPAGVSRAEKSARGAP